MKMAAAAACEHDRLRWVHVAQVWQDLARCAAQVVSIAPEAHAGQTNDRSLRHTVEIVPTKFGTNSSCAKRR